MKIRLNDIALVDFQNALVALMQARDGVTREALINSTFDLLEWCLTDLLAEGRICVVKADETHLDVFKAT